MTGFLSRFFASLIEVYVTLSFIGDGSLQRPERIEVLDFATGTQLLRTDRTHAYVRINTH